MRSADPRGLRNVKRVPRRGSRDDGLLCPEPRQLSADTHPPQLGHHSVDHARRPTARVVLADRTEDRWRFAVPDAPDTGAHRHVTRSQRSGLRGIVQVSIGID